MGGPTSSYVTAGIAFRVSGALKPHHHNKVEIPLVGLILIMKANFKILSSLIDSVNSKAYLTIFYFILKLRNDATSFETGF
jgi:hypothetical protein